MRTGSETLIFDAMPWRPLVQSSVDNIVPGALTIQILSGQFLTDKHVGTYVEVSHSTGTIEHTV